MNPEVRLTIVPYCQPFVGELAALKMHLLGKPQSVQSKRGNLTNRDQGQDMPEARADAHLVLPHLSEISL